MNNKTQVIYWTGQVYNDSADSVDAVITEQFNSALVEKCTDYVLAVERFEVNLNGVPFYDIDQNETITFTYDLAGIAQPPVVLNLNTMRDTYSMLQLIDGINRLILDDGTMHSGEATQTATTFTMALNIDDFGFVYFSWDLMTGANSVAPVVPVAVTNMVITLGPVVNQCLGLEDGDLDEVNDPDTGYYYSRYPRFDTGDLCEHVRLVSNLMLISDTSGQAKTNIVTDVAAISSYVTSHDGLPVNGGATNFSFSQRQKLVYQPTQRRWLNFAAPVALTYISIWAEYVRPDGESVMIKLPRGAMFAIKLGFYYRQ